MSKLEFTFYEDQQWTMKPACCDPNGESRNPAPATTKCIYIIHNANSNQTYVGYADDAKSRWGSRYESFHCFGIEASYALNIRCAYCVPELKGSATPLPFEGANGYEHFFIRAVVNGLLGVTISTNTKLRKRPVATAAIDKVSVWLPTQSDKWGKLSARKTIDFPTPTLY